jgi:methionyl-tRNA synthetase
MKKFITSALPYVNNQPHLGNIIGCVLSADVYSRYCKRKGEEAVYICGTDEYGTAIEMAAIAQNKTPIQICEENRVLHRAVYDWFNIHFDHFGFTSSESHKENVQDFFRKIYSNGYFDEQSIDQLYCEACQLYLADRYVTGTCPVCKDPGARGDQCDACGHLYKTLDLADPLCTLCDSAPVVRPNTHLFFRLGDFKAQLMKLYEKYGSGWSQNGQNIFNQWMSMDLHPRCMTRDLKYNWGVPVPLDGFRDKVFYVWFDAPIGYLTFLKELVGDEYQRWREEAELVQFMGKDNVSFHTIIFPAMLMATGEKYPLVSKLAATEFLQFENQKFSKSRKHGIFGLDLLDNKLGTSCIWRFYLLKIRPETGDANFSFLDFRNSVTGDLINNLGNFCNRVLKFVHSRCQGRIRVSELSECDMALVSAINRLYREHLVLMEAIRIRDALCTVLEVSRVGNGYVQGFVKMDKEARAHGFSVAFSVVVFLEILLHPFLPVASEKIRAMCNLGGGLYPEEFKVVMDHQIGEDIAPLFTLTPEQLSEVERYKNEH